MYHYLLELCVQATFAGVGSIFSFVAFHSFLVSGTSSSIKDTTFKLNMDGFLSNVEKYYLNLAGEAPVCIEVSSGYCAKNVVNSILCGDRAVEGDKVPFQPMRNVIPPSARMVHRSHVLNIKV